MKNLSSKPTTLAQILCSLAATFVAALALLTINMQDQIVVDHYPGYHPSIVEQLTAMGAYFLPCLALLPLVVWVPRRWVPWALVAWSLLFAGVGASLLF